MSWHIHLDWSYRMELKKRSSAVGKEEYSSAVFKIPPWRHMYTLQSSGYFPHLPILLTFPNNQTGECFTDNGLSHTVSQKETRLRARASGRVQLLGKRGLICRSHRIINQLLHHSLQRYFCYGVFLLTSLLPSFQQGLKLNSGTTLELHLFMALDSFCKPLLYTQESWARKGWTQTFLRSSAQAALQPCSEAEECLCSYLTLIISPV